MSFIMDALAESIGEVVMKYEVNVLLRDMIESVEIWDIQSNLHQTALELMNEKTHSETLRNNMAILEKENIELNKNMSLICKQARKVRDSFIENIGRILQENASIIKMKNKLKEMEQKITIASTLEKDLAAARKRIHQMESINTNKDIQLIQLTTIPTIQPNIQIEVQDKDQTRLDNQTEVQLASLQWLEDKLILRIFSFLLAHDVLATAQLCRVIFTRVDVMFGIDSKVIKQSWSTTDDSPSPSPSPSKPQTQSQSTTSSSLGSSSPVATGNGAGTGASIVPPMLSTRDSMSSIISDTSSSTSISMSLSQMSEMKAIGGLLDRCQTQTIAMQHAVTEKEDSAAKLQSAERVKDFLLDKLRSAELALKQSLDLGADLRRQNSADNEVITYLDQRTQVLETQLQETDAKNKRLQAALDLQTHHIESMSMSMSSSSTQEKSLNGSNGSSSPVRSRRDWAELPQTSNAHKRILVKEVKSLRKQLASVVSERDELKTHMQLLKRVLDHPPI
eukprot:gene2997-5875_t